jgi:hypothetical protein
MIETPTPSGYYRAKGISRLSPYRAVVFRGHKRQVPHLPPANRHPGETHGVGTRLREMKNRRSPGRKSLRKTGFPHRNWSSLVRGGEIRP